MFQITEIREMRYTKQSGKEVIFDPSLSGFGVRLYPSGKKVWYVQWNRGGNQGCRVLGDVEIVPQVKAREAAKKLLAAVVLGQMEIKKVTITFDEFADLYMERHAKVNKKSWQEDERRLSKHISPIIGKKDISTISRADVALLVSGVGSKFPYQANRVKEQLSKMFELAIGWGYLPEESRNPAKGVPDYAKEIARDRWLTSDEIKAVVLACHLEDVTIQSAIRLYLLTALRKRELLKLKWSDVNYDMRHIVLPGRRTKSGQPLCLPLSEQAINALRKIPPRLGNPYVFPGRNNGAHLTGIDKIWQRIRERCELQDVQLHDLRRTVASHMVQNGQTLHVVGNVLNQSSEAVTAKYGWLTNADARKALEEHGARIASSLEVS